MKREIEVKFRIADLRGLARKLRGAGFGLITRRTHEINTLYDLPGEVLREKAAVTSAKVRFVLEADPQERQPNRTPQQPRGTGNGR